MCLLRVEPGLTQGVPATFPHYPTTHNHKINLRHNPSGDLGIYSKIQPRRDHNIHHRSSECPDGSKDRTCFQVRQQQASTVIALAQRVLLATIVNLKMKQVMAGQG